MSKNKVHNLNNKINRFVLKLPSLSAISSPLNKFLKVSLIKYC